MPTLKDDNKVTLEALLKVKQQERPEEPFWDSFERDIKRRRFNSLLEQEQPSVFSSPWLARTGLAALPILILGLFYVVWQPGGPANSPINQSPLAAGVVSTAVEPSAVVTAVTQTENTSEDRYTIPNSARAQFVTDVLSSDRDAQPRTFRKVLYSPAIETDRRSDLEYIRDSFQQSGYQLSTATYHTGRNF